MTVTVTLPTTPEPYLETGVLAADFYAYEGLKDPLMGASADDMVTPARDSRRHARLRRSRRTWKGWS
jgi:hypothetical protein